MGTSPSKKEGTASGANNLSSPNTQFVTPTGLYPNTNTWDLRTIKKLILSRKLSPLFPGKEQSSTNEEAEECPICFLYYPCLNRSSCCKKGICTECFIQIKKPNVPATCPFCNRVNYTVAFTGALSKEEKDRDAEEQQKVIELKIKIRNEEIESDRARNERKSMIEDTSKNDSKDGEGLARSLPNPLPVGFRDSMISLDSETDYGVVSASVSPNSTSPIRNMLNDSTGPNSVASSQSNNTSTIAQSESEWRHLMPREDYELALAISLSLNQDTVTPVEELKDERALDGDIVVNTIPNSNPISTRAQEPLPRRDAESQSDSRTPDHVSVASVEAFDDNETMEFPVAKFSRRDEDSGKKEELTIEELSQTGGNDEQPKDGALFRKQLEESSPSRPISRSIDDVVAEGLTIPTKSIKHSSSSSSVSENDEDYELALAISLSLKDKINQ